MDELHATACNRNGLPEYLRNAAMTSEVRILEPCMKNLADEDEGCYQINW
jgi:hypothetical protein